MATEQTAFENLAATPGKIIATDVTAVQKLAGNFGAGTFSGNRVAANSLALKNSDVTPTVDKVADQKPGRHAKKAGDNNPVSSAIKAIKEASSGSYVGKHRADAAGTKVSVGNDEKGSKGSTEK